MIIVYVKWYGSESRDVSFTDTSTLCVVLYLRKLNDIHPYFMFCNLGGGSW